MFAPIRFWYSFISNHKQHQFISVCSGAVLTQLTTCFCSFWHRLFFCLVLSFPIFSDLPASSTIELQSKSTINGLPSSSTSSSSSNLTSSSTASDLPSVPIISDLPSAPTNSLPQASVATSSTASVTKSSSPRIWTLFLLVSIFLFVLVRVTIAHVYDEPFLLFGTYPQRLPQYMSGNDAQTFVKKFLYLFSKF